MTRTFFIVLASVWLSASVCNYKPRVARHFALNPQPMMFYQALALSIPSARLMHIKKNPQWSAEHKLSYLHSGDLLKLPEAQLMLAQTLYQLKDYQKALLWLQNSSLERNQQATLLRAKTLLAMARYDEVVAMAGNRQTDEIELFTFIVASALFYAGDFSAAETMLKRDTTPEAKRLKAEMKQLLELEVTASQCLLNIQFLVNDYKALQYAAKTMSDWQADEQVSQLPVCFAKVQSFSNKRLKCSDNPGERAHCDMTLMATHLDLSDNTMPVVVQGDKAKANYDNGIIFINHASSYGVFKHEIMHHFGFIDEYPLPPEVARRLCRVDTAKYVGENLYVFPKTTQKHTIPPQMMSVRACDNADVKAYKPVAGLTLMEFMDQPLPPLYVDKAAKRLRSGAHKLANYQYAFALAFLRKGEEQQYIYWLKRSAQQGYEAAKSLIIKEKIKQR